jgi:hypothetical protein
MRRELGDPWDIFPAEGPRRGQGEGDIRMAMEDWAKKRWGKAS